MIIELYLLVRNDWIDRHFSVSSPHFRKLYIDLRCESCHTDPTSTLHLPLMILYPLAAQSDFIKKVDETSSLGDHLSYILPPPWDGKEAGGDGEYADEALVECYCETATGGLSKVGKKISMGKILGGGKIEVVDGLVVVNVLPKARAQEWIALWKERHPKMV